MNIDLLAIERRIPAQPETIFDLLAAPSRHHEIDGSGAVRTPKSGPVRLELGATFVMSMKMGIPYSTVSTVVEFEENRRIAWQTYSTIKWIARWGGGRIWRYELHPDEEGTLVRETWDISRSGKGEAELGQGSHAALHGKSDDPNSGSLGGGSDRVRQ